MKKIVFNAILLLMVTSGCHAGNQSDVNNGISAAKIIKSIDKGKPIVIEGMIIADDLDFTMVQGHTVFSTSYRIAEVNVPVTFLKCIFLGKVKTIGTIGNSAITTHFKSNLTFEGCDFRAEVDFSNATIDGMVNFTGAVFRGNAIFNNISIDGRNTYFTSFSSEKLFSMQEAFIGGSIDFFKGHSKGKISFQSTDIAGVAQFSNLQCDGKADFSLATFRSQVLFTYSKFNSEFRMSGARCDGNCEIVSVVFGASAWICNSVFNGKVNFNNTEAVTLLDVSGSIFAKGKPDVEGLKLSANENLVTNGTKFVAFSNFDNE